MFQPKCVIMIEYSLNTMLLACQKLRHLLYVIALDLNSIWFYVLLRENLQ